MKLPIALVLLAASLLGAQAAPASVERPDRLESLLTRITSISGAPGGVIVRSDGARVERRSTGLANRGRRVAMTPESRFRVASVTKMQVATVVLQLVGEGRLRLGESVGRLLPGRVIGAAPVTVRQLLSHTSGLYGGGPLAPEPGAFRYDNSNFILLGEIVESITGSPVRRVLERRIWRPLGLTGTAWPTSEVPTGIARGYGLRGADVTAVSPRALDAADALVSTAGDLQTFLTALLGGDLLAPAQLAAMRTAIRVTEPYRPLDDRYGLGLMGYSAGCGFVWGHRGRMDGYTSYVFGTADGSRTIVVELNIGRIEDVTAVRLNRLLFAELCRA